MVAHRAVVSLPALMPPMPLDTVICGDALDVLRSLPDACVDAIVTDPPYFRVKDEAWDRQWGNAAGFLAWMATLRDEWRRVLKPDGSLYVFASPQMAARVEVCLREGFNVLNSIRWLKQRHTSWRASVDQQRQYLAPWEAIIFAEQYGSDSMALGEQSRDFLFEHLRAYLDGERRRAHLTCKRIDTYLGTANVSQYWWQERGFTMPTAEKYAALQRLAPGYFCRPYESLRSQYDALRADYEELRRPFSVTTDTELRADTWTFAGVPARTGRHPCEKPLNLMRHIIRSSTREGALVLDCFAGSGATLEAARLEGRYYLGIERDARYVAQAEQRLAAQMPHAVTTITPRRKRMQQPQRPPLRSLWEVTPLCN